VVRGFGLVGLAAAALTAAGAAWGAGLPGYESGEIARFDLSQINALATSRDGRVVVVGLTFGYPQSEPWVRAYLPDGHPDPSFGQDGKVELDEPEMPIDVAVQNDGGVVVLSDGGGTNPTLIHRLTAGGMPDPTFGNGGVAEVGCCFVAGQLARLTDDRLVALYWDGSRITLIGLSKDGAIDRGFGSNGYGVFELPALASYPTLTAPPPGGLLATGVGADGTSMTLARFSPDGRLDASFGADDGIASLDLGGDKRLGEARAYRHGPVSPLVLRDGRMRVPISSRASSSDPPRMALLGLTRAGRPDVGFGNGGVAIGPRPARDGGELAHTVVGDAHGGILVAGDVSHVPFGGGNPLLRRFHRTGAVDRSFKPSWIGDILTGMELLDADNLVLSEYRFDAKYRFWGPARLWTINAGYDTKAPEIAIAARDCRTARVRVTDLTGVSRLVVRANGRLLRRTPRTRFRVRVARGVRRISVRATDMAGNASRATVRLPRCTGWGRM
jgi:uncharacterized delta-60 repeat protein